MHCKCNSTRSFSLLSRGLIDGDSFGKVLKGIRGEEKRIETEAAVKAIFNLSCPAPRRGFSAM
ncbi:hypothetical protein EO98_00155 [Methanosarcina sp. 2.H.T.1A.6]|nr:hypothetical protein EO94_02450 [Methanosarcina sp. 2.H.T.1A.3]KKG22552.1 hypothetical protein EO97_01290 [Methanosarcina sp. 2.H.T.1A.15]KKG23898.1 hypothetical protein EO98_00155 [Methanosarcina sp. 2.H.T.1A.6]KKG26464.1 hypothetical protein EO96_05945 [Methanosarcina sp. 2.H.T.1A.8]